MKDKKDAFDSTHHEIDISKGQEGQGSSVGRGSIEYLSQTNMSMEFLTLNVCP